MSRTILHSDCNGFYASVECLYHPEIRNKPVIVAGDPEMRHGIVLAKNELAKKYKIKTGETIWAVKQRCPDIVVLKPNYKRYLKYAKLTREIYNEYTDQMEPFGLDEAFLDVGGSAYLFGDGEKIAHTIRERIKNELGITVSVGVSFNKAFAKLGSDLKKPDAVTIITKENYKDKVWPLPISDLLYVGSATALKLNRRRVYTIGDLAKTSPDALKSWFGINGIMLWQYANGEDMSIVSKTEDILNDEDGIKSIGNSTTTPRDLLNENDVNITVSLLSDSVAARLREHKRMCKTIQLWLRDSKLNSFERQCKTEFPTQLANEIKETAMKLYYESYGSLGKPGSDLFPLRSIGVRACNLIPEEEFLQMSFFPKEIKRQKLISLERAIDNIRGKYGHPAITRGIFMGDDKLGKENPKDEHLNTFPANGKNN